MARREAGTGFELGTTLRRLGRWREQYGGRGQPIPEDLWDAAVEVARVEGVASTARALRLDRGRLASRVEVAAKSLMSDRGAAGEFVELDARGLCSPGQTVVRMTGRDGERFEIALSAPGAVDVVDLARAFWARSR